jgi:[acyl-carrier-protein] S-malonyltransferase
MGLHTAKNVMSENSLAFVFPGQGSQSVGMMAGLAHIPVVRETFTEAEDLLKLDLWQMVTEGPAEDLSQTVNTQPLMLTAGVATWRAWLDATGIRPTYFAGHSLGEFSALVAAEVLSFADAVPLVRFRAEAMQDAVPAGQGGIAAILGLDDEAVKAACLEAAQGEVVEPANYNSPGQLVISGTRTAVERAIEAAKAKGAKRAVMLPMSVPAHSSLMRPAAERLRERIANVAMSAPKSPVIQNVDVKNYSDPEAIKDALIRQLYGPVRWIETIKALADLGVKPVVECGPGKVLVSLNKRIDERIQALAITDQASIDAIQSAVRG